MSIIRFYLMILKKAFTTSFEKADAIAGFIGMFGVTISFFNPKYDPIINLVGLLPAGFLCFLFIYRLIFAPFWIYKEEKSKKENLEERIKLIEQTLPSIEFDQFREVQLYRDSPVIKEKASIYRIIQVWFKNAPLFPSSQSVAKQVTAIIEFWNMDETNRYLSVYGQWASSTAPDHVGFSGTLSEIDITPGHIPSKLMIALKYLNESMCFAYCKENIHAYPDGRHPSMQLHECEYKVCVYLKGIGVDKKFWFIIINPGIDKPLEMKEI